MLSLFAAVVVAAVPPARAGRFECLIEPYLEVNVASAVAGILDEVRVDRGDRVREGEVVATLRSDVQRAQLELVKARSEFAERRVVRNQELFLKQMISPHEKDELETEAQLLRLELVQLEKDLEQRTIRSPLEGVVVERSYSKGEYVADAAIVRLAQVDPLRVEVAVPVSLYGKIRVGMVGQVEWETSGSLKRQARVTVVDPVVDAASGTIGVRLELANPDLELPAGVKCWVTLPDR